MMEGNGRLQDTMLRNEIVRLVAEFADVAPARINHELELHRFYSSSSTDQILEAVWGHAHADTRVTLQELTRLPLDEFSARCLAPLCRSLVELRQL